jgi:hypothetical protein
MATAIRKLDGWPYLSQAAYTLIIGIFSTGRKRKLKSLLGTLNLTTKQAERLRIEPYSRSSPLLEKCCLLLSANKSYQDAERDVLLLAGVKVGHSTQHRKVKNRLGSPPDMKGKLAKIAVDGGTVRIRGEVKVADSQSQQSFVKVSYKWLALA